MYKILLDTTQKEFSKIKLVKIEAGAETVVEEIEGQIDITTGIREILEKNHLTLSDVSEVVPVLGPGSFTGLKAGVTVANIINWAANKKPLKDLPLPEYGREPNIQKKW